MTFALYTLVPMICCAGNDFIIPPQSRSRRKFFLYSYLSTSRQFAIIDTQKILRCNSLSDRLWATPPTIVILWIEVIKPLPSPSSSVLTVNPEFLYPSKENKNELAWNLKNWGHPLGCVSWNLCLYSYWDALYQIGDRLELWSIVKNTIHLQGKGYQLPDLHGKFHLL
jgi:hypothetical protein